MRLDPRPPVGCAVIARLQPDRGAAGNRRLKGLRRPQEGDAIAIAEGCWGPVHGAPEAVCGPSEGPLPALELWRAGLASRPAQSRRLDTLAVQEASARLGRPPASAPERLASLGRPSAPDRCLPPSPKGVRPGVPWGTVVGQAPPWAARAPPIEPGLENGTPRRLARAARGSSPWPPWLEPLPCVIGQICRRRATFQACTLPARPPSVPPFQTVSELDFCPSARPGIGR